jgi:hypothetical protein
LALTDTDMMLAFVCLTHARRLEEDLQESRPLSVVPDAEEETP